MRQKQVLPVKVENDRGLISSNIFENPRGHFFSANESK